MVGVVLLMCLFLEIYQPILVIDFCRVGIIVGSVCIQAYRLGN